MGGRREPRRRRGRGGPAAFAAPAFGVAEPEEAAAATAATFNAPGLAVAAPSGGAFKAPGLAVAAPAAAERRAPAARTTAAARRRGAAAAAAPRAVKAFKGPSFGVAAPTVAEEEETGAGVAEAAAAAAAEAAAAAAARRRGFEAPMLGLAAPGFETEMGGGAETPEGGRGRGVRKKIYFSLLFFVLHAHILQGIIINVVTREGPSWVLYFI